MNQKHILKNGREIEVRTLTTAHLDEILTLQQEVIATLTTASSLQPLSIEEFSFILDGKGLMIGAYFEDQLIAFRAMLEPEIDVEHLGIDAGLPESEWPLVIYSEITNVRPDFRGNGLQVLLGKIIMEEVDQERFRYIAATVAPFNIPSLADKFAHGLQIVALKEKYDNMLRYILMKDLAHPVAEDELVESTLIQMSEIKKQQNFLQSGWTGTGIEKINNEWHVQFKR